MATEIAALLSAHFGTPIEVGESFKNPISKRNIIFPKTLAAAKSWVSRLVRNEKKKSCSIVKDVVGDQRNDGSTDQSFGSSLPETKKRKRDRQPSDKPKKKPQYKSKKYLEQEEIDKEQSRIAAIELERERRSDLEWALISGCQYDETTLSQSDREYAEQWKAEDQKRKDHNAKQLEEKQALRAAEEAREVIQAAERGELHPSQLDIIQVLKLHKRGGKYLLDGTYVAPEVKKEQPERYPDESTDESDDEY